jgi:hypothetical protein
MNPALATILLIAAVSVVMVGSDQTIVQFDAAA